MTPPLCPGADILVLHAGALGDGIMVWPLLRALVSSGRRVAFATTGSRAALAARAITGLIPIDGEHPLLRSLWHTAALPAAPDPSVRDVILLMGDADTASQHTWRANVARLFPRAALRPAGPPGSSTRTALFASANVQALGHPPARTNNTGPLVIHIGAGSAAKTVPIDFWLKVLPHAASRAVPVRVIAGEAERERLNPAQRSTFLHHLRGVFLDDLDQLHAELTAARAFIGADSGPSHLAAQLGISTIAIFGPTDPAIWHPVGPRVTVIAPETPQEIATINTLEGWLKVKDALDAALT